ncbi:uncharacterized protein LOC128245919 [Mya arenaria]|uniref:uncharacterized protein LOC128245919 n=1 Tax=Mya arenaria TaxID=6604 RepID=UPI0022DFDED3|nr:uncharacterized protein LOC128245919 [Mya arenaria]
MAGHTLPYKEEENAGENDICVYLPVLQLGHFILAFGLDTTSFLNAFYRMVNNRRGLPVKMLSDNGKNFIGAEKELKDLVLQLDKNHIEGNTANKGIEWQFNPPLAPHWGGVHESLIKSAKKAIVKILGTANVTDEELMTAFIGAEDIGSTFNHPAL